MYQTWSIEENEKFERFLEKLVIYHHPDDQANHHWFPLSFIDYTIWTFKDTKHANLSDNDNI